VPNKLEALVHATQKYRILPERKHDSEYYEKGEIFEGQVEAQLEGATMTLRDVIIVVSSLQVKRKPLHTLLSIRR
jgi:hypothetical protein